MYFACQAMAAEMSTGLLALGYIDAHPEEVSMLVLDLKSIYMKKAVGKIEFACEDGIKVKEAIEKAISTGEAVSCLMDSKGYDQQGDTVSSFQVNWTFKLKN